MTVMDIEQGLMFAVAGIITCTGVIIGLTFLDKVLGWWETVKDKWKKN